MIGTIFRKQILFHKVVFSFIRIIRTSLKNSRCICRHFPKTVSRPYLCLKNSRQIFQHFLLQHLFSRFFSSHCNKKRTELHHNCHISHHKGNTYYHHGGILIEFAFSIPIMIILLLFVHDHYRFYELKSKLKSSAYLVASMIQQLSNTRSDKQLTSTDLAHIVYASCLNLFHSNSVFSRFLQ